MTRFIPTLALVVVLGACGTTTIVTDPGAYSVRGETARLKSGERIALVNGYPDQSMMMVGDRIQVDARQVMSTAIAIMSRHLEKNGVTIDANAQKKVTLKLANANTYFMAIPFAERWRTNLDLDAVLGDGTTIKARGENSAPAAFRANAHQRSVEGAVLFAVTNLLNEQRFVSYVGP